VKNVDVVVMGAGAIGLYLGGRLAASGLQVHFVGRAAVVDALKQSGLDVIDLEGRVWRIAYANFSASVDLSEAPAAGLYLLCVKGAGTETATRALATACEQDAAVISFQNGVDNLARIARVAPTLKAVAGMVPFNVIQPAPHRVQQATSGRLAIQRGDVGEAWAERFSAAGLPLDLHADMRSVQWGKLLLNLNNPLNALAGIPLLDELGDRHWRRILAHLQDEALAAMTAARITPARVTPLPPRWLPTLLRLPTPLFRLLARRMLSIDPEARSSMYVDRVRGRATEIDDLCGAVVRLAAAHGVSANANSALVTLLQSAPLGRYYRADEVAAALDIRIASR